MLELLLCRSNLLPEQLKTARRGTNYAATTAHEALVACGRSGKRRQMSIGEHEATRSRKIDLATAAVIAYDRATSYQDARSVYENRQLLLL